MYFVEFELVLASGRPFHCIIRNQIRGGYIRRSNGKHTVFEEVLPRHDSNDRNPWWTGRTWGPNAKGANPLSFVRRAGLKAGKLALLPKITHNPKWVGNIAKFYDTPGTHLRYIHELPIEYSVDFEVEVEDVETKKIVASLKWSVKADIDGAKNNFMEGSTLSK